jgi:hypothetical protein
MQFKNPVTGALPAYDGFYALARTTVAFDTSIVASASITPTNRPKIDIDWDRTVAIQDLQDLIPNGDYDFTTDKTYKNGSATPCSGDVMNWTV